MKKEILSDSLIVWLVLGVGLSLIVAGIIGDYHVKNLCKLNGFDGWDNTLNAQEGYIVCCNTIYENGIEVRQDCEGVEYE